jgi:predicted amidophosphoribosyltransferase
VVVAAEYAGVVRTCLLAYKERGRRDLARPLAAALAAAVAERVDGPLWFVPIPSADAVARRRGGQHVERLARLTARILRRRGVAVRVAPILALAVDRPDNAELTAAERGLAAAGKYVARPGRARPSRSTRMVIVDDLVTTGNTVAAAAAALRVVGLSVAGAAAVAGTQRRTVCYTHSNNALRSVAVRSTCPASSSGLQWSVAREPGTSRADQDSHGVSAPTRLG